MEDYAEFRERMNELNGFIETCETKEIDGVVHITIDDDNVEDFMNIVNKLVMIASSEDGYVDEILEYLNELDKKITDKNMIAKFICLMAAMHCQAKYLNDLFVAFNAPDPEKTDFKNLMNNIPRLTGEVKIDDWIMEINDMTKPAPFDARFGKVINIVPNEDGSGVIYRVKAPLANEIVEWEDAAYVVIPNMEETLKKYQEKYTKTF